MCVGQVLGKSSASGTDRSMTLPDFTRPSNAASAEVSVAIIRLIYRVQERTDDERTGVHSPNDWSFSRRSATTFSAGATTRMTPCRATLKLHHFGATVSVQWKSSFADFSVLPA